MQSCKPKKKKKKKAFFFFYFFGKNWWQRGCGKKRTAAANSLSLLHVHLFCHNLEGPAVEGDECRCDQREWFVKSRIDGTLFVRKRKPILLTCSSMLFASKEHDASSRRCRVISTKNPYTYLFVCLFVCDTPTTRFRIEGVGGLKFVCACRR